MIAQISNAITAQMTQSLNGVTAKITRSKCSHSEDYNKPKRSNYADYTEPKRSHCVDYTNPNSVTAFIALRSGDYTKITHISELFFSYFLHHINIKEHILLCIFLLIYNQRKISLISKYMLPIPLDLIILIL